MMKKVLLAIALFTLPIGVVVAINPQTGATIERMGDWVEEEMAKMGPQKQFKTPYSAYQQECRTG